MDTAGGAMHATTDEQALGTRPLLTAERVLHSNEESFAFV
jgi:hypothetical protein